MENKEDTYNKLFIPNVNGVYVGNDCLKKKENLCCKLKKGGRSVTTIREILHNICANGHPANLPSLPDRKIADKQLPKSNKIL